MIRKIIHTFKEISKRNTSNGPKIAYFVWNLLKDFVKSQHLHNFLINCTYLDEKRNLVDVSPDCLSIKIYRIKIAKLHLTNLNTEC